MGIITAAALSAKINQARLERKAANIGCGQGLVMRVSVSGKCTFLARAKQKDGKLTNLVVGDYPKISLSSAREKAKALIEQTAGNKSTGKMFKEFADERLGDIRTRGKNDKRFYTVRAFRKALEPLDNFRLDEITTQQAIAVIGALNCSESKKHHTAKFLNQLYNEAMQLGLTNSNPFIFLTRNFKRPKSEGYAWVRLENLQSAFWQPLINVPDFCKLGYLLIAFSGLRLGSAAALRWDWINDGVITVPGEAMKMGQDFRLPITPHLQRVLEHFKQDFGYQSDYVIYHWSPSAHKINTFESMPFRHLQGPVTANCHGTCTIHGLRKTLRTWLAESGINFEVAEACLAHEEKSAVVRAYQKYDFLDERREVMTKWGDALIDTLPDEFKRLVK